MSLTKPDQLCQKLLEEVSPQAVWPWVTLAKLLALFPHQNQYICNLVRYIDFTNGEALTIIGSDRTQQPNPKLQGQSASYRDLVKLFPNLIIYRAHYWDLTNDDYFHDDMNFLLKDLRARYLSIGQIYVHEMDTIRRAIATRIDRYGEQFTLFYYGALTGGHVG